MNMHTRIRRVVFDAAILLAVSLLALSSLQTHEEKLASTKVQSLAAVAGILPPDAVDTANVDVGKLKGGAPEVKQFCVRDADQNGICIPAKGELTYYSPSGAKLTCAWDIADPKLNACINSLDVRSAIARGGVTFTPEGTTLTLPIPPSYGNPYLLDAFSGSVPDNKPYEATTNTAPNAEENLAAQKAAFFVGGSPASLKPGSAESGASQQDKTVSAGGETTFGQDGEVILAANRTVEPALKADAKLADVVDYLKNDRQLAPDDWVKKKEIWPDNVQVLAFGDEHESAAPKEELVKILATGVTHLMVEFYPTSRFQKLMQDYMDGRISRERMINAQYCDAYFVGCGVSLVNILDEAKKMGVSVLPIESERSADEPVTPESMYARNKEWASNIQKICQENPDCRVVVFGGAAHMGYVSNGTTVNQILAGSGISSRVVSAVSLPPNEFTDIQSLLRDKADESGALLSTARDKITSAAVLAGLDQERFILPLAPGEKGTRAADFVLHLGQKAPTIGYDIGLSARITLEALKRVSSAIGWMRSLFR
jgi:hypothetical protein